MTPPEIEAGSPGPAAAPARRRRATLPVVLVAVTGTLAVLLLVATLVVLKWPTALPGETDAEKATDRDLAVRVAATTVTKAFLDVDYRGMDARLDKVLALSTGTFKNQYETARASIKSETARAKTVATGAVRRVGIADIGENRAVVYVAADSTVTNVAVQKDKGADGTDSRVYRFQLDLKKVGDRWLLENLQFIS
jgi:Mce-associated membrane protein